MGDTYPNRTPNFYTVVAVDNITKCQSAKATVQVLDNTVLPVIATTKTDQTSCDIAHPNGSATANVGGTTTGYTFTWYAGSTAAGTPLVTGAALPDRAAGTYTVKVVNDATGCTSTAQVSIINNTVTPVVSTAATPMTICKLPSDGSVSANVGGNTTNYTFYWFDGNVSTPNITAANHVGDTYADRQPGFYTVVAVSNSSTCQSAKATVQVMDNTVLPAISTTKTDNTSCDMTSQNGQASANVGGVTAGYTFTWYEGVGTSGLVVDNTAATLAHLKVMTYTVKVVNNNTGCSSTAQVSIGNNQVPPVVSATATPMTLCNLPSDGSVSANVGGTTTGYTFYWFDGNVSTPNITAANHIGDTYPDRQPGFYTVVAVDNTTKCQSAKATAQVLDNTVLPAISTTKTDNTSCDMTSQNGQASANVGGVSSRVYLYVV